MNLRHQLLFVQGGGEGTHDQWDSKLVASLRRELGQAYEIHYPRMPSEADPSYASWKPALDSALEELRDGAILVGHSVGGTLLIKRLTEHPSPPRRIAAVILIAAPFVGDGGWPADELQFPAELGACLPRNVPIHFYHGLDDEIVPPAHVDLYARAVPRAHIHRLAGRDHQLNDDLTEVAATISSLGS